MFPLLSASSQIVSLLPCPPPSPLYSLVAGGKKLVKKKRLYVMFPLKTKFCPYLHISNLMLKDNACNHIHHCDGILVLYLVNQLVKLFHTLIRYIFSDMLKNSYLVDGDLLRCDMSLKKRCNPKCGI